MTRSTSHRIPAVPATALLLTVAAFIAIGCTPESSIDIPPDPDSGTIVIDPNPAELDASWTLAGPDATTIEGDGDTTITEARTGEWTISWHTPTGWYDAVDSTATLAKDATVVFSVLYVEIPPDPNETTITIQPGSFTMGSPPDEPGRYDNETARAVEITSAFRLQATEVTWGQYAENLQWAFDNGHASVSAAGDSVFDGVGEEKDDGVLLMHLAGDGSSMSYADSTFTVVFGDENLPASQVTWYGAAAYCDWLSMRAGLVPAYDHADWSCNGGDPYGATGVRLPTEAEWEYGCRAGTSTAFSFGPITDIGFGDAGLDTAGWYGGNAEGGPKDVNTRQENPWGLYDMHGNLWEWCNDRYEREPAGGADPAGPAAGERRVYRGGYWNHFARGCRSASRAGSAPGYAGVVAGFRTAISGAGE